MKKTVGLVVVAIVGVLGIVRVAAQSWVTSDLSVGFPLEVAVPNGSVRVLIPTATDAANVSNTSGGWDDGVPDTGVFVSPSDQSQVTVTCPNDITGMAFGTPTKQIGSIFYDIATGREVSQTTAATLGGNFVRYLAFTCPYTGSGAVGGQFAANAAGTNILISGLLNPAATSSGTVNEAVVIPAKIQLLQAGYTSGVATDYVVSDYDVAIGALAQEVLVTATIEQQLMFRIDGVAAGTTVCGDKTTSVETRPLLIDYGAPSVGAFVDAAQQVFIDSSATGGYKVTLAQNKPMSRSDVACSNDGMVDATTINRDCIPNFGWEAGSTPSAAVSWTSPTRTGVGYTVMAVTPTSPKNTPVADARYNGGQNYARLATTGIHDPTQVASSAGIAEGDVYDVCYRLSVDAQNNAGVYNDALTYTITASF